MNKVEIERTRSMMSKKTIAIIGTRGLPANYGGFETMANHLSDELAKRGFEVYVSCETQFFQPRSAKNYGGIKIVYFPIIEKIGNIPVDKIRNLSEPGFYDVLSLIWSSLRADYVLMLGCYFPFPLLVPRLFGRKVLVHVDGLEWKRRKLGVFLRFQLKQFEKIIVQVANQVIVDSPAIGQYYDKNYRIKSLYWPIGVEEIKPLEGKGAEECLKRLNLHKQQYYLVIARLEPENNIDLIISEFIKSNSERDLIIVGPLKNSEFVKKLLQTRDKRVRFLGGIFDQKIQRTLRHNCYAYIHGHEVGGANPSLIEALSCDNRILALDCIYTKEVAESSAIYFSKFPDNLKSKIELVDNPENIKKLLLTSSYSLYLKKYTVQKMADAAEELFRKCP